MKLLLASLIAAAFAASPAYAQQPTDKDKDKAKAESAEASSSSNATADIATAEAAAVNADAPIAPEVLEVVNKKKRYTTSDLVKAQLDAVNNAPPPAG